MAKKKAVRRENGRGTVEKTSNKKNERYFASLNSESSKRNIGTVKMLKVALQFIKKSAGFSCKFEKI